MSRPRQESPECPGAQFEWTRHGRWEWRQWRLVLLVLGGAAAALLVTVALASRDGSTSELPDDVPIAGPADSRHNSASEVTKAAPAAPECKPAEAPGGQEGAAAEEQASGGEPVAVLNPEVSGQGGGGKDDRGTAQSGTGPDRGPARASEEPWVVLARQQRALLDRLRATQCRSVIGVWSERTTSEILRGIAAESGVPVDWDPAVEAIVEASAPRLECPTAQTAWRTLLILADRKSLSVRLGTAGLTLVPFRDPTDLGTIERFSEDPFAAFATARWLAWSDMSFHDKWATIAECEAAPISLAARARSKSRKDVLWAIAEASHSPALRAFRADPTDPPPGEGQYSGRAVEVLRSWSPGLAVFTGRSGLALSKDPAMAERLAADKRDYERSRLTLQSIAWPGTAAEASLREVADTMTVATGGVVLLDPAVENVTVHPVAGDSLLEMLEREGTVVRGPRDTGPHYCWTFAAGMFLITISPEKDRDRH